MIDFGRLQADVVKDWCKHSEEHLNEYKSYNEIEICGDTYVPVIYKGCAIYFVPTRKYKLSTKFSKESDKVIKLVDDVIAADELTTTNIIEELSNNMMRKLEDKDGKAIWLNLKLLKPFKDNIKFYGKGDVVLVKDRSTNQPLGIVLAIHRSDTK